MPMSELLDKTVRVNNFMYEPGDGYCRTFQVGTGRAIFLSGVLGRLWMHLADSKEVGVAELVGRFGSEGVDQDSVLRSLGTFVELDLVVVHDAAAW